MARYEVKYVRGDEWGHQPLKDIRKNLEVDPVNMAVLENLEPGQQHPIDYRENTYLVRRVE